MGHPNILIQQDQSQAIMETYSIVLAISKEKLSKLSKWAQMADIFQLQFIREQPKMGTETSTVALKRDIQLQHPVFHSTQVIMTNMDSCMQISLGCDKKNYEAWKQKSRPPFDYLLLPSSHEYTSEGICSSSGVAKINFPLYGYLLSDQIDNLRGVKSCFKQTQLWELLYGFLLTQQHMAEMYHSKIGDVTPHSVFINSDGKWKVACLASWPNELSNIEKAFVNPTGSYYLAPEEIDAVRVNQHETQFNQNSQQAELFSIGVTVLCAASLCQEQSLALWGTHEIEKRRNQFAKFVDQWKRQSSYSVVLRGVIANLCSLQPQERILSTDLRSWMNKFSTDIKAQQPFTTKVVPKAVQDEIQQIQKGFVPRPSMQPLGTPIRQSQIMSRPRQLGLFPKDRASFVKDTPRASDIRPSILNQQRLAMDSEARQKGLNMTQSIFQYGNTGSNRHTFRDN